MTATQVRSDNACRLARFDPNRSLAAVSLQEFKMPSRLASRATRAIERVTSCVEYSAQIAIFAFRDESVSNSSKHCTVQRSRSALAMRWSSYRRYRRDREIVWGCYPQEARYELLATDTAFMSERKSPPRGMAVTRF